ncbi:CDK5 regulatory subunit associated protein 2, partial [Saguinus oedipus]
SETPPLSGNDTDSLSCNGGSSATSTPCVSRLVTGHRLWADKNGCHVLGLIEDYEALLKQIGQGQRLLAEMDIQTQETPTSACQELGTKGPHLVPLSKFVSIVSTARLTLEEAYRRLTRLWRVSLPSDGQCPLH